MRDLGGAGQFLLSFVTEIVVSVLYAPLLMVQQSVAVARTWIGYSENWTPQARQGGQYGGATVLKFHAIETVSGILLTAGMLEGIITLWLLPIAASLLLAVPLSMLSGAKLTRFKWTARQLGTAEVFNAPEIITSAKRERVRMRALLEDVESVAAE